ncbi:MAG TPA: hypothetical protein VJ728_09385 [Candidatus Binataceae bacterium]|nr:hypothetical protein [Candidatus Binataceae bacterium]
MSARLLINAICDLNLAPLRASNDEIRALRAAPDLDDWYEYADSIWSANAIAESLLRTYRNLKGSGSLAPHENPSPALAYDWWCRCQDVLNEHFEYWALGMFLAGMAVAVFK